MPQHISPSTINPELVVEELEREKQLSKTYFDRGTKDLSDLIPNQPVRMLDPHENIWKRGTVVQMLPYPRSYLVQEMESGATYRRNRQALRADETPPQVQVTPTAPCELQVNIW